MNKLLVILVIFLASCDGQKQSEEYVVSGVSASVISGLSLEAENFTKASADFDKVNDSSVKVERDGWLAYTMEIPTSGRYEVRITALAVEETATIWVEDYYDNQDGRTYNITGNVLISSVEGDPAPIKVGSPMKKGIHKIKVHVKEGDAFVDKVEFKLLRTHIPSPVVHEQKTEGSDWGLVWSDEFDGSIIDTTKWTYDLGNWGWGNNELQYYTENRPENARVEEGNLIIEARKNDMGEAWTSARLTTRGKHSFLYGKIEFRAIVPREKGNWAAGWTLGDEYVDEISWPYCGEIDILESVGYEVDNTSGDGIAHATVHTPAYYFKINNQISSTIDVKGIANEFHTYAVEWTPSEVRGYVDGEHYYTYDKNANEREWPFAKPQNLILNLAMGGGWGGAQGMDPSINSQKFIIDYVRVYESK